MVKIVVFCDIDGVLVLDVVDKNKCEEENKKNIIRQKMNVFSSVFLNLFSNFYDIYLITGRKEETLGEHTYRILHENNLDKKIKGIFFFPQKCNYENLTDYFYYKYGLMNNFLQSNKDVDYLVFIDDMEDLIQYLIEKFKDNERFIPIQMKLFR